MKKSLPLLLLCLAAIGFSFQFASHQAKNPDWETLFNGKDLQDWTVKIRKHELNENFANTFRVEDGLMKVRYDGYDQFDQQYGHIFYQKPYSYYLLQVEYRFVGEQAKGGEGWATRNSGAMLHCQDPKTMLKDQDFPISIEAQFLGGNGKNPRSTCNLCTPGTNVVMDEKLITSHCVTSSSQTYHGDQWVTANFIVMGDGQVHHMVGTDTVISYSQAQIGGGNVAPVDPKVKQDGKLLNGGYISLQSESHPIDFRTVRIIDLSSIKDDEEKLQELVHEKLSEK
ncbi:DUF1080 domain-containing protein [Algoriphagus halophytocola]|uniref:DUF1080 domain-containing protein n=1 Tax=Algoriphagus halophytocola TaxID=2991499 RepID=A0ABY6MNZ9_9BACT|nr:MULTISPECIES: DUF1080 domain-containing protein [unclassified Algoriphagus]UZD24734.1 DUF1080 domain-containing protein [Algoriphagus sp. TR-M5]WBL45130.1 DUF1080 domain-containing protein [Algoriphagus sp. TR-M9]